MNEPPTNPVPGAKPAAPKAPAAAPGKAVAPGGARAQQAAALLDKLLEVRRLLLFVLARMDAGVTQAKERARIAQL